MEKDLNKIKLLTGETAVEFLKTVPAQFKSAATSAIYECLNRNIPLIDTFIQETARAIIREGRIEKRNQDD